MRNLLGYLLGIALAAAVGCGGDDVGDNESAGGDTAGDGGTTGEAGGGGTGGTSGTPGESGTGGTAGGGGEGGTAGSDIVGSGGGGGNAGSAGEGGAGGVSGEGGGGNAGGGDAGVGGIGQHDRTCDASTDCMAIDCGCECTPVRKDNQDIECPAVECDEDPCVLLDLGDPEAVCNAGRCVLDVSCDASEVFCFIEPPACSEGWVPSVASGCWGDCVPVEFCGRVTDCSACGPDLACVTYEGFISTEHCVEKTDACAEAPTCECMGESVCIEPYNLCDDSGDGIQCICITC